MTVKYLRRFHFPPRRPLPELVTVYRKPIRLFADIALMFHVLMFLVTLFLGIASHPLWLVASILIGCLMVMIPFATDALIRGASFTTNK